ncbi:bifunctional UDP-N-acetylmuramoyl-tripeptide:D-alanyl-D-alanine ligase/alanine racemase [Segetibacter aerophilus]|uniref:Alanine racemase n=1 Tax=Segetibacter aerophilus TaxID=670293 RepID=A0A512B6X6_9BACT|nr:bifunctional UDP-N-acetylmuramoyl-tripeptide:D-alanyl-D-alanine ligase/alanine racemase [Segetibacter aerophilus]GEO07715.1 bifunctional UDP-N-acetylmuramoyl-tripeptide:D-alanyl-D-alanine ligase/alanine racemase [Segetibacter aerophilus]
MPYSIQEISGVISDDAIIADAATTIEFLLIDSRRLVFPESTLFFALSSPRRNGETFIEELYKSGVKSFIVSRNFDASNFTTANFLFVDDPLRALQKLAAFHRKQFQIPVVGITGSNGKTIVKEWLYQLLQDDYNIVRSPKSYNSQIGVPLSVWQLNETHTLAIFEAGISEVGEMDALEEIIQPTIGILTNVGAAHSAGFASKEQKVKEKLKLFHRAYTIVSNNQDTVINSVISQRKKEDLFIWGSGDADLKIVDIEKTAKQSVIAAIYSGRTVSISIPFTDNASVENAITCWSLLLYLHVDEEVIKKRMLRLQSVEMRLQLKRGINNCSIINDSYSNDLSSLRMALEFLHQQAGNQATTVILSDLGDTSSSDEQYQKVLQALLQHKVQKFIGIGSRLLALQSFFQDAIPQSFFYNSVESFIHQFLNIRFRDEVILLKGARSFEFEQINLLFEQKVHQTVLEVNLSAMAHNLKEYQRYVQPTTKVMAMVKAFSYGSGSAEVASVLQFHKVDYLAVAYADEGVELRKAGIHMPIMVMNPEVITFQSLVEYNLEPEMYSFAISKAFNDYLQKEGLQQFPVHIKIDTGMHRLGFEVEDIDDLIRFLTANPRLVVKSVFSHLVASENTAHDAFTQHQAEVFLQVCEQIKNAIGYSFIRHISNSAAIFRYPQYQFELVRLGIGLYGVDSSAEKVLSLQPVATLRSTIAQIRAVKKGETVGYSRRGLVTRDSLIATIRIGYADGFNRRFGNGVGHVFIKGTLAPVIGSVCMDMTMIDITDVQGVTEGDVVEIFGTNLPIEKLAQLCDTIPYEIMTSVSQRVKREYYQE